MSKKKKIEMKTIKISKVREYEIDRIKSLLEDPTLRQFERFNLNVYLKSLLKNGE